MKVVLSIATALLLAGCGGSSTAESPVTEVPSQPAVAAPSAPAVSSAAAAPEIDPTCEIVARVRAELPDLEVGPLDDEMASKYRGVVTALQLALPDLTAEAAGLPDSLLTEKYRLALSFMKQQTALYLSQLEDWSISDGDGSRQLKEFGAGITGQFDEVIAKCGE
jgi:hypothetical protein